MAKVIVGNHSSVIVPRNERDGIRKFYCDVLGGKITTEKTTETSFVSEKASTLAFSMGMSRMPFLNLRRSGTNSRLFDRNPLPRGRSLNNLCGRGFARSPRNTTSRGIVEWDTHRWHKAGPWQF